MPRLRRFADTADAGIAFLLILVVAAPAACLQFSGFKQLERPFQVFLI
jgi:hypothetical protein